MKGKSPSAAQKRFHDALCRTVGCVACAMDGRFNDYVSIHHIDGRTKPDAHWKVLPLCASHHQDDGLAIAVHPRKAVFETRYGKQMDLLVWCIEQLQDQGVEVAEGALAAAGYVDVNRNEIGAKGVVSSTTGAFLIASSRLPGHPEREDALNENAEPT